MFIRAFFLLVIALLPVNGLAAVCTLSRGSSDALLTLNVLGKQIEKAAQVALVRENPRQFCEINMTLRYLNVNPKDSASANFACTDMSKAELEKFADKTLMKELSREGYQPWFFSLIPTASAQQLTISTFLEQSLWSLESPDEMARIASDGYRSGLEYIEQSLNEKPEMAFTTGAEHFEKALTFKEAGVEESVLAQSAICADLKVSKAFECQKALARITEMARPGFHEKLAIAPIGAWKQVMRSERKYTDGLRRAALKITQKLKLKDAGGSNIFDDLFDSFKVSGLSGEEAMDATYQTLALYGNGGANLGQRMQFLDRAGAAREGWCRSSAPNVCGYLDLIARAIPTLDFFSSRAQKPLYSFPKGVAAECNTNKSYHFWMAAYLSRELVKEGYSADVAALASYAAAVGYQINRNKGVDTAKIGLNALKRSTYDPVNNVIRADLAYARAGADFGAAGDERKAISIDENLVKLMKSSPEAVEPPPNSDVSIWGQIQRYSRFREVITPKALVD